MRTFIHGLLAAALFAWLMAPSARAQDPGAEAVSRRPTVGLTLSGGGALGCAHVGVLQTLENLRVPVDYIGGTSIGAIIGGLYASGLSPDEIEDLLVHIDWRDVFTDTTPRRDLSFRRKDDDRRYLFNLEFGFRHGRMVWPSGLISGQKLNFILQSATLQVPGAADFDRLPTPFRAVATDMETGERIILSHGSLTDAMRASMAVFGIFTPVEIDGRLLIDGGVVNNLPVDVVKDMGADPLIAVDVRAPLSEIKGLPSLIHVSLQAIDIAVRQTDAQQAAKAALVLRPP